MSEHDTTHREEVHTNLPKPPRASWGAILVGLFAVLSTSWLLYLMGVSIGVSVADASDSTLIQSGLPEGAILWMLLSALVAYFVGGAVAARLSGTTDESVGMLHGFALWSVATTILFLLGYCGVTGLLQTGQSFASSSAQSVGGTAVAVGRSAGASVAGVTAYAADLSTNESELAQILRDEVKQRAAKLVESLDPEGGEEITAEELRTSIDQLDRRTLRSLVRDLLDDDQEGAAQLIADQTDLTEGQAAELIAGAYDALEERFGNPDNEANLAADLGDSLAEQAAKMLARFDEEGEPRIDTLTLSNSLKQIDRSVYEQIGAALLSGNVAKAKNLLVSNSDLTESQVDEIVDGVTAAYDERIAAVSETANEYAEAFSSYAQAVLWSTFAATALGLAMAILGGWCGADTTRRLYFETVESTNG